jgi:hypothetical protein
VSSIGAASDDGVGFLDEGPDDGVGVLDAGPDGLAPLTLVGGVDMLFLGNNQLSIKRVHEIKPKATKS